MSDATIGRRYAQALYREAEKAAIVSKVDDDIELIQDSLEASKQLVRFFASPIISRDKKETVVRELFEKRLQPLTFRFLMLLVDKQREELFPAVVRAYRDLRDQQLGVTEAYVRTAQSMDEDEEERLTAALENMTGQKVRMNMAVDPELIGGVIIRLGDTVYDGSVRNQLAALHEKLKRGATILPAGLGANHRG